jgi:hypothetical protein
LLPLLQLMLLWFVVFLIMPGLLPLLQLIVPCFVVSYKAGFVASLAAHGAVVCCLL